MRNNDPMQFGINTLEKLLSGWVVIVDDYVSEVEHVLPRTFAVPTLLISREMLETGTITIERPRHYQNMRFVSPEEGLRLMQSGYDLAAKNIFNNKKQTDKSRYNKLERLCRAARTRALEFDETLLAQSVPKILTPAESLALRKEKLLKQMADIEEKEKLMADKVEQI